MNFINRIVVIITKLAFVLLVPYYCVITSDKISLNRVQTTYLISNTIGYWVSPGYMNSLPQTQEVFWQQNQPFYSILFILPMILFALFFGERKTDLTSFVFGIGAVLVSYVGIFFATPMYTLGTFAALDYLIVPNVVSLSMFMFVFWSLLRNSLPQRETTEMSKKKEGAKAKIREGLRKWFPRNVATLIWICLVVFPTFLILNVSSEGGLQLSFYLLGGLYSLVYNYIAVPNPGIHYTVYHLSASFETAAWASFFTLAIWILNLLLGIVAIQYIRGKATKWIFYRLTGIVFLILVIPNIFLTMITNLFTHYQIPLPFFLVAIVLAAKYIHLPTESPEEMIKVPLRTRISSFLHRSTQDQQISDNELTNSAEENDNNGETS